MVNTFITKLWLKLKRPRFFSVLADEATDVSNKEQMPLILRLVDKEGNIHEDFIMFILCENGVSGEAIADSIVSEIRNLNLDMNNCHGQRYDGAGNMAGKYQGAAACIQRQYPLATYVHCASHRLNLCIVSSCQILLVERMMDKVKLLLIFSIIPQKDNNCLRKMSITYYRCNDTENS